MIKNILIIIATILLLVAYILAVIKIPQIGFIRASISKRTTKIFPILAIFFGIVVVLYLFLNLNKIPPEGWVGISLTAGLVAATGFLVVATMMQVATSIKLAEITGMPRIIQRDEAVKDLDGRELDYFSHFSIYNAGNGPAIELEIFLLNDKESQIQFEKKTFLRAGESLVFYPSSLKEYLNSDCFLLCRYQSTYSDRIWDITRFTFKPIESKSAGKIIIKPGKMQFERVSEKKSY